MTKWKIVAYIFFAMFAVNIITMPFSDDLSIWYFVNLIAMGISLIPLYGFGWQIAIGNRLTSTIIFSLNSLGIVIALYAVGFTAFNSFYSVTIFILTLALFGLFLYPQFMYAFKSNDLWAETLNK